MMSKGKNYWATVRPEGWAVMGEGASRASSTHGTQAAAWAEARRLAEQNNSEAFLQNRQGQIRERNSFGHDPSPPKG